MAHVISWLFLLGQTVLQMSRDNFCLAYMDHAHFQRQVLLESVTNLHRMISLLLFITLCFGEIFCAIDRSKHKPCVFAESMPLSIKLPIRRACR